MLPDVGSVLITLVVLNQMRIQVFTVGTKRMMGGKVF